MTDDRADLLLRGAGSAGLCVLEEIGTSRTTFARQQLTKEENND